MYIPIVVTMLSAQCTIVEVEIETTKICCKTLHPSIHPSISNPLYPEHTQGPRGAGTYPAILG